MLTKSSNWQTYKVEKTENLILHFSTRGGKSGCCLRYADKNNILLSVDYTYTSTDPETVYDIAPNFPDNATAVYVSSFIGNGVSPKVYRNEKVESIPEELQKIRNAINATDVVSLNKDIRHIILSCSGSTGGEKHKYLTALHCSDLHGDIDNYSRIAEFANHYKSVLDCVIDTGDDNATTFSESDHEDMQSTSLDVPFLFSIGNHDTGYRTSKDIKGDYSNTLQGIAQRYIAPKTDENGYVKPDGKAYYYRDFTDYKVRVICPFEYEMPRLEGGTDRYGNPGYLYNYWYRYISQEQADWFVESLRSLESGWSVVIVMHQLPNTITTIKSKFNTDEGDIKSFYSAQTGIISDIVDAYIGRTAINKSYTAQGRDYGGAIIAESIPNADVLVNTDFSSSNGQFMCYLVGHSHQDHVGVVKNTNNRQLVVQMTTSSMTKSTTDDITRVRGCKSQDCLNMVIFDTDAGRVRLLRVGANQTNNMEWRDMESVIVE